MQVIYKPKGRALEYSLLAANLYRGCVHGCLYCYAPSALRENPESFRSGVIPRRNILRHLRKDALRYIGTNNRVLLCFTCDPYPPLSMESGVTREALRILREHDIPFQILTKAGMLASRDFDLYGANARFASTLTYTQDDGKTLEIEGGAALPSDRMRAIRTAKDHGITTWVSLEPVLDADESLCCIEQTHGYVDLYKIGKLNYGKSDIDWREFGIKAIGLCHKYQVDYYIKQDLASYLDGIDFKSIDTRKIESYGKGKA